MLPCSPDGGSRGGDGIGVTLIVVDGVCPSVSLCKWMLQYDVAAIYTCRAVTAVDTCTYLFPCRVRRGLKPIGHGIQNSVLLRSLSFWKTHNCDSLVYNPVIKYTQYVSGLYLEQSHIRCYTLT